MNKLNVLNILTGLDQQSSHQNQPMKCSLIENKMLYNKVSFSTQYDNESLKCLK